MTLRAVAGALALVVLFGASRPGVAATGVEALIARGDSIRAIVNAADSAAAKRALDTAAARRAVASDSAKADTGKIARRDSLGSSLDSAKRMLGGAGDDSLAKKPRSLPPRTLTLRQQVMFAGGFMAFVAIMMASMQNFNP